MNVLELDSLELSYGERKILSDIYMQCKTGEVVGLLGRNGSGKSSLMKVVFGALDADHKSIRMNGASIGHDYIRKRLIAYLPQESLIPSYLSIRSAFNLFGISIEKTQLFFPRLNDFLDLKPGELSGGYLRIVETLLILHSPAPFCILDEPFTGLMPIHVEKLGEIITQAKQEKGIIITDHMHKHVTALSDKVYLLSNGRSYEIKQTEQLIELGYLPAL